jgi:hypothetical protein
MFRELFEIVPDGSAAARFGPHKVILPANLADPDSTNNPNLLLVGRAPMEVASIRVNGATTNTVLWTSVTNWSIGLTLTNGANPLTVQGYGRTNNLLAGMSDSITVTNQP